MSLVIFSVGNGSSKSLVLKSLASWGGTLSLLVSLTLWDGPVLCTPPSPSPNVDLMHGG